MPTTTTVTRRTSRFYIYTGPESLLIPAPKSEIVETLAAMRRQRHVNVSIVEHWLRDIDKAFPLPRINLLFLAHADLGETFRDFAARYGVTSTYDVLPRE